MLLGLQILAMRRHHSIPTHHSPRNTLKTNKVKQSKRRKRLFKSKSRSMNKTQTHSTCPRGVAPSSNRASANCALRCRKCILMGRTATWTRWETLARVWGWSRGSGRRSVKFRCKCNRITRSSSCSSSNNNNLSDLSPPLKKQSPALSATKSSKHGCKARHHAPSPRPKRQYLVRSATASNKSERKQRAANEPHNSL